MRMPTKAMFEEWEEVITTRTNGELVRQLEDLVAENVERLEAVAPAVVDALIAFRDSYWHRLSETALYSWLKSEPGFQRASSLLRPRRSAKRPTWEELRSLQIGRLLNRSRDPVLQVSILFRKAVGSTWDERVVAALERYLFEDHESIFQAKRDIHENCKKAKAAIQAVAPLFLRNPELLSKWIAVSQRELDRVLLLYGSKPVRNSRHKAEHAFVEDMWRANRNFFRTAKPAVIAELMTLPCFEHQFDLRHIAKICSALTMSKSAGARTQSAMAVAPPDDPT